MDLEFTEARDRAWGRLASDLAAFATGAAPEQVRTRTRGGTEAGFARQLAMYLCHVGFGMTLGRIGRVFHRNPSTVAHACHAMEDRREEAGFDAWCTALEETVRAAPPPVLRLPEADQ